MDLTPKETNYYPSSMSFAEGFLGPRGDVGFIMKADFIKAKEIVNELIKTGRQVSYADMGLDGDWDVNSERIFDDGSFINEYTTYDHSQWAPTILIVCFTDGPSEMFHVWKKEEKS